MERVLDAGSIPATSTTYNHTFKTSKNRKNVVKSETKKILHTKKENNV